MSDDALTPAGVAAAQISGGLPAAPNVQLTPSLALAPFTGLVQALERCWYGGYVREAGEFFQIVEPYTLRVDDPFLPANAAFNSGSPSLVLFTPFLRDFFPAAPLRDGTLGPPLDR